VKKQLDTLNQTIAANSAWVASERRRFSGMMDQ
jgi:hypothetical protein